MKVGTILMAQKMLPDRAKALFISVSLAALLLFPPLNGHTQDTGRTGKDTGHIPNPVLPGVADAGVLHYNGEYYIGGVATNGSFYRSSDLVNWEGPFHVFSMDNDWTEGRSADDSQIHASDIHYLNGRFHHYWSVNYWGKDRHAVHIGHAVSSDVLGPYVEPVKDTWLANRIDPHLFRDKDGRLYLYMVKFTDGNTIWARPMKDPATFSGEPRYLFASLPGTWETLDNRVAEGPWVIRYRSRYYLMYNANHTSTAWGNYSLGVAEADGPLEFTHGSKYPHPVLTSNQTALEAFYPDLLKFSSEEAFRYTFSQPGEGWNRAGFDDAAWQKGKPGFGSSVIENSTTRLVKTHWNTERIWIRKSFHVNRKAAGNLSLRMHHDGETRVFLNGTLIYNQDSRQYIHWNFDEKARSLLKDGENLLAIESREGNRSAFLDAALFDMKDIRAGDILFSPGQPSIVRGPNGFEWWLVYMANKNAERRGQYVNRIHFFGKKLTVDGVTDLKTPGYRPLPAAPIFSDLFSEAHPSYEAPAAASADNAKASQDNAKDAQDNARVSRENANLNPRRLHPPATPENRWQLSGGKWGTQNGEFRQTGAAPAIAIPRTRPAAHYLFEAGVRVKIKTGAKGKPGTGRIRKQPEEGSAVTTESASEKALPGVAGIYACRKDENNWLKILLNPEAGEWTFELNQNGNLHSSSFPLPDDFNYDALHKLSVHKNAAVFRVSIDGLPAPVQPVVEVPGLAGQGLPGLFTSGTTAAFDGILYTIGWDEFDSQITGWETASGDSATAAGWIVSENGISPGAGEHSGAGEHPGAGRSIFKGDLLAQYEFSVQVGSTAAQKKFPEATRPEAGIYPVYIDGNNYLKAVFDQQSRQLVISGKKDGKLLETRHLSLETLHPLYADMKYTDFMEKQFTFDTPTWINALRFSKTPHERPDTLIEDIYRKMNIFYRKNDRWHPLENYRETRSSHPGFDKISFVPLKATAIKLVNKEPTDHQFYTYKLWTNELFRESNNLRVSKLNNTVIFWVNGKEVFRMPNNFPASRVGLTASGGHARFNGITLFSLGNIPPE